MTHAVHDPREESDESKCITEVVDQKKSTKHRLDALDWQSTRLCDTIETLEEKVKIAEAEIHEFNIQLDERQMICVVMTNAVAILPDLWEEMEATRLQLRILQHVVGNG
ncbi:Uncharacterized protein Adt_35014 [Abeliophyllum distichum]|uniref:Uncharacterized protein n=1 Tax=Abeliophyllum distichum TaxID=126358 RepID=A0ABD1QFB9_9LAMI